MRTVVWLLRENILSILANIYTIELSQSYSNLAFFSQPYLLNGTTTSTPIVNHSFER